MREARLVVRAATLAVRESIGVKELLEGGAVGGGIYGNTVKLRVKFGEGGVQGSILEEFSCVGHTMVSGSMA